MNSRSLISAKQGIVLVAVALTALCSCERNTAKVSGRFIGGDSKTITLEQIHPANKNAEVDTIVLKKNGSFSIKTTPGIMPPTLYNLNVNGERISMLLSPGDRVVVNSFYCNPKDYTINGSQESALIKEINEVLRSGGSRLDSIYASRVHDVADKQKRREGMSAYTTEYNKIKRKYIAFLATNCNSLASVYALSQKLPNGQGLLTNENDLRYCRLVVDSVSKYYPYSPYLIPLKTEVNNYYNKKEMDKLLSNMENIQSVSYPDLELSDMYNVKRKLSDSQKGKVVLLDFWAAGEPRSAILNAELKEIYDLYAWKGFEVYQVCLDSSSKSVWVNAVQEQALPWVSVIDTQGLRSATASIYNVKNIPYNYLIDHEGNIVAQCLYGRELEREVAKQMRKLK